MLGFFGLCGGVFGFAAGGFCGLGARKDDSFWFRVVVCVCWVQGWRVGMRRSVSWGTSAGSSCSCQMSITRSPIDVDLDVRVQFDEFDLGVVHLSDCFFPLGFIFPLFRISVFNSSSSSPLVPQTPCPLLGFPWPSWLPANFELCGEGGGARFVACASRGFRLVVCVFGKMIPVPQFWFRVVVCVGWVQGWRVGMRRNVSWGTSAGS